MKCGEPKPGDSWRSCELELKHTGKHRYLNETWPRPVPNEPDPDVEDLLDHTRPANAWGLEERRFPIVVVETTTRVLWVDGENEDDALAYWADDWSDIPLKEADVINGDLEFRRLEEFERQDLRRSSRAESKIGPLVRCPGCAKEGFQRAWFHDPYRKCHGPIQWQVGLGRPMRKWEKTPVYAGGDAR